MNTMNTTTLPPLRTPDAQPYWDGLDQGRLLVQRCSACGTHRHYPRPMCPVCHALDPDWVPLQGHGTVHSWTVLHQSGLPGLVMPFPLTLLTVDMAEGVRVLGLLLGNTDQGADQAAGLHVGAAVRASVGTGATGVPQPVFHLV
jgi:uncharacterized OB-fold protein